ncbi:MAG TPA: DUF502 domain-containing protein, partial [Hyphomicrobiales bacterium]|nr:DUF502 domain-containing protein [Hyphomicrobiales bacterium]
SRFWRTSVIGSFLAGLLFLLPIILTIFIIAWIVNFVRGSIGPDTILGVLLTRSGTYLLGANQDKFAFWLGAGLVLVGIWLLGLIVKTRAKSIIQNHIDSLFTRVPLIRLIYGPVSRVVRLATERRLGRQGDLSNMGVVSCRFFGGGEEGVDVLALLASQEIYHVAGQRRRLVYLPAAPIPMSGGLVFVAEKAITPVADMKVEDLLKIYVSLGALAPEAMPQAIIKQVSETLEPDKEEAVRKVSALPSLAEAEPVSLSR